MKILEKMIFIGVSVLLMEGCTFADPNKVISIENDKSRLVVTQADKRAIFTFQDRETAYACSEPSPDVKADIESAIKALMESTAELPDGITATAKAELDATRKLVTAALLERSQGLQVLRDMLFQACLANLRGDMERHQYVQFVTERLPLVTTTLIAIEMITQSSKDGVALTGRDLEVLLNFATKNVYTY